MARSLDGVLAHAFLITGRKEAKVSELADELGVLGGVAGVGVSVWEEEVDAGGVGEVAAEGAGVAVAVGGVGWVRDWVGGRWGLGELWCGSELGNLKMVRRACS